MTSSPRRRWTDGLQDPPDLLAPETTVAAAAERLADSPYGAVFLRSEEGDIGLLTASEIRLALHHGFGGTRAADLMEGSDSLISARAPLSEAALRFARSASPWLPVVDGGRVVGLVGSDKILSSLARSRRGRPATSHALWLEKMPARALEVLDLVGAEGRRLGAHAFLIGGAVRDCLLQRGGWMPDLDVAVEGDAAALARAIALRARAETTLHGRFGTATVIFAEDGLELNLARTRTESYAHPGALPQVRAAPLSKDLARRDFTVNAMALSLDSRDFGRLHDPLGGEEDVAAGCLRVLHPLSFVEDPTRMMRGARFASRLGFALSEQTARLMAAALKVNALERVSGERILSELERAFGEPDPPRVLACLSKWGILRALHPALELSAERLEDLRRLDEALIRIAILTRDLKVDRTEAFLLMLARFLPAGGREKWLGRLGLAGSSLDRIASSAERLVPVLEAISKDRPAPPPSRIRRLLDDLPPVGLAVCLTLARETRPREAVESYLGRLRSVRTMITGADLKEMGYPPGPIYRKILAALLEARLDGLVTTREDEARMIEKKFRSGRGDRTVREPGTRAEGAD